MQRPLPRELVDQQWLSPEVDILWLQSSVFYSVETILVLSRKVLICGPHQIRSNFGKITSFDFYLYDAVVCAMACVCNMPVFYRSGGYMELIFGIEAILHLSYAAF